MQKGPGHDQGASLSPGACPPPPPREPCPAAIVTRVSAVRARATHSGQGPSAPRHPWQELPPLPSRQLLDASGHGELTATLTRLPPPTGPGRKGPPHLASA